MYVHTFEGTWLEELDHGLLLLAELVRRLLLCYALRIGLKRFPGIGLRDLG